jgi:uncharacterized protein
VLARLARGVGAILEGDGPTRAASSSISARLPLAESSRSPRAQCCALWRTRTRREPVLIVVDEAHNVCPQLPDDGLTALATEDAIRIAGAGRKFGLCLLLATRRPDKLHANVLSQCDNLVLMRLNSEADLAVVRDVFSFVPPGLLERICSHPAVIRFGERISEEGGADVPATWAER